MFAVAKLARFFSGYNTTPLNSAKQTQKYLNYTKNFSHEFQKGNSREITEFTDSSYDDEIEKRRSTSGYVFLYNGTAISWKSRMKTVIASSSLEAEYIAQAMSTKEAIGF